MFTLVSNDPGGDVVLSLRPGPGCPRRGTHTHGDGGALPDRPRWPLCSRGWYVEGRLTHPTPSSAPSSSPASCLTLWAGEVLGAASALSPRCLSVGLARLPLGDWGEGGGEKASCA